VFALLRFFGYFLFMLGWFGLCIGYLVFYLVKLSDWPNNEVLGLSGINQVHKLEAHFLRSRRSHFTFKYAYRYYLYEELSHENATQNTTRKSYSVCTWRDTRRHLKSFGTFPCGASMKYDIVCLCLGPHKSQVSPIPTPRVHT
jgi:hypothetical protein